jgi:hypothetical protein
MSTLTIFYFRSQAEIEGNVKSNIKKPGASNKDRNAKRVFCVTRLFGYFFGDEKSNRSVSIKIHLKILLLTKSMPKTRIERDEIRAGRLFHLITLNLPLIQG